MTQQPKEDGSVPKVYCRRQEKWLAIEEHVECEYCAGPVYDEAGDPVSFLCTHDGERRDFQPNHEDSSEEGRGYPSDPDRVPGLDADDA